MTAHARIQIEGATRGHIVYVLRPDPETAAALAPVIQRAIEEMAAAGSPDPATALIALLVERDADIRGYEAEAQRRGHLPL
jgi:hypothetical protein